MRGVRSTVVDQPDLLSNDAVASHDRNDVVTSVANPGAQMDDIIHPDADAEVIDLTEAPPRVGQASPRVAALFGREPASSGAPSREAGANEVSDLGEPADEPDSFASWWDDDEPSESTAWAVDVDPYSDVAAGRNAGTPSAAPPAIDEPSSSVPSIEDSLPEARETEANDAEAANPFGPDVSTSNDSAETGGGDGVSISPTSDSAVSASATDASADPELDADSTDTPTAAPSLDAETTTVDDRADRANESAERSARLDDFFNADPYETADDPFWNPAPADRADAPNGPSDTPITGDELGDAIDEFAGGGATAAPEIVQSESFDDVLSDVAMAYEHVSDPPRPSRERPVKVVPDSAIDVWVQSTPTDDDWLDRASTNTKSNMLAVVLFFVALAAVLVVMAIALSR